MLDDTRFTALHTSRYPEVLRYALRRVGRDMAEEVAHETFVALWVGRRRIPAIDAEQRAWVFRVARNQLVTAQRREAGRRRMELRLLEDARRHRLWRGGDVALDVLERDQAWRCWRDLGPAEREVMALATWEGLTPREMAVVMGVSVTAVTTRLLRARRHVEALMRVEEERP